MKKAIELADTTFRAYKKMNGATALHLRTHLIVHADAAFRAKIQDASPSLNLNEPMKPVGLSAFMKFPRCWLQLPGRKQFECEVSHSCFPATRAIQRPAGGKWVTYETQDIADEECTLFYFWAKMIFRGDIFGIGNVDGLTIANMKLVFHLNFPGRASDEKIIVRRKVPVVRLGQGW